MRANSHLMGGWIDVARQSGASAGVILGMLLFDSWNMRTFPQLSWCRSKLYPSPTSPFLEWTWTSPSFSLSACAGRVFSCLLPEMCRNCVPLGVVRDVRVDKRTHRAYYPFCLTAEAQIKNGQFFRQVLENGNGDVAQRQLRRTVNPLPLGSLVRVQASPPFRPCSSVGRAPRW